uniref:DUF569 domain-containing protein n=1 Tax=Leersia perrieri TaxID=77586 RepID=A0A0D9X4R5_9ORYZ
MEFLQGVEFVRLRSYEHESYAMAGEDGRSVYLAGAHDLDTAPRNTVWAVEPLLNAGTLYVLFRGPYGRYLGAPVAGGGGCFPALSCCSSLDAAAQLDRGGEAVRPIMWRPIRCGNGVVNLRDGEDRYLRGNESSLLTLLGCGGDSVSVDGDINDDKTLRWELVAVPRTHDMPELPIM